MSGFSRRPRKLGDVLIVALNSDASIRRLKGPTPADLPAEGEARDPGGGRGHRLCDLFPEDTPRQIIAALLPDVLVKGGDWKPDEIVGREEVEAAGGRVVIVPYLEGQSTSSIIRQSAGAGHGPGSKRRR